MGKTDYSGIDYGNGKTNIDFDKNIRYGVIPQNEVLQFWADESEPNYSYYCPFCEMEIEDPDYCYRCEKEIDSSEFDCLEPYSFSYNNDGYICEQSYDDPDIFILKSPYYSFSQFCSPCAPGAGYLMNELNDPDPNNKTYCFGHDIFEETETNDWIDCYYCNGTGFKNKKDIPNYNEENPGIIKAFDDKKVYCWVCYENLKFGQIGKVKKKIRKAPYRIFSVRTNEEVFADDENC